MWNRWRIMTKCGNPLKNHDGLHTLEGYWHSLFILRYKHRRYQGCMLMVSYIGMYTKSQKRVKTNLETIVGRYNKGDEIIFWCSLCVRSCLVSISNCYCMHCCYQNTLHQICMSWIDNYNICWGSSPIHLLEEFEKKPMSSRFENHLWW
jgi:hypothetical protein